MSTPKTFTESVLEKLAAAQEFVDVWRDTYADLPALTCSEAEALEALFRAYGMHAVADDLMLRHAETDDDPEDRHYRGPEST